MQVSYHKAAGEGWWGGESFGERVFQFSLAWLMRLHSEALIVSGQY